MTDDFDIKGIAREIRRSAFGFYDDFPKRKSNKQNKHSKQDKQDEQKRITEEE